MMLRAIKAVIDKDGSISISEPIAVSEPCSALVIILDEQTEQITTEPASTIETKKNWHSLYRPIRLIGRGGMGETYLAVDIQKNTLVCVKCLLESFEPSALLQECRALARLSHPHIVRLLNFDTLGRPPYLVLEFVDGLTLSQFLEQQGPVTEHIVLEIGRQIFDALAFAHEQEVLHCDLKPGNILLEHNPCELVVKMVDFGLAVVDKRDDRDAITAVGRFAGTPHYMSPEQAQGLQLSGACDVYAAGQILWEAFNGRRAFSGTLNSVIYQKYQQSTGLKISRSTWNISNSLADLIESCTHPDPSSRLTAREALSIIQASLTKVSSPSVLMPANLGFDSPPKNGMPPGWFDSFGYVNGVSTSYEIEVVPRPDVQHGKCVRLRKALATEDEFGSLMQRIPGNGLAGRPIRLEAEIRTENVRGWAGIWLRVDGHSSMLFFDNMHNRPIRGTTDWATYSINTVLPTEAKWINYGVLLVGPGTVWVDSFSFYAQNLRGEMVSFSLSTTLPQETNNPLT